MSIFDIFKKQKVELTEEEQRWNKIWDLWADEKAESPYQEIMTYHSEINCNGHFLYFLNLHGLDELEHNIKVLEKVLPSNHLKNFKTAYEAYNKLDIEEEEELAQITLEKCDEFFFENEMDINLILCDYACKIEL